MMSARKSFNYMVDLMELQLEVLAHCQALRAVTDYLEQGKVSAAIARLEGSVAALQATIRGQCVGQTMSCPACNTEQDVVAWVDDGNCRHCGVPLDLAKDGEKS